MMWDGIHEYAPTLSLLVLVLLLLLLLVLVSCCCYDASAQVGNFRLMRAYGHARFGGRWVRV